MDRLYGKCVGGPDNGKMMAHHSKRAAFFEPSINPYVVFKTRAVIEPRFVGAYEWTGDLWKWVSAPTTKG